MLKVVVVLPRLLSSSIDSQVRARYLELSDLEEGKKKGTSVKEGTGTKLLNSFCVSFDVMPHRRKGL